MNNFFIPKFSCRENILHILNCDCQFYFKNHFCSVNSIHMYNFNTYECDQQYCWEFYKELNKKWKNSHFNKENDLKIYNYLLKRKYVKLDLLIYKLKNGFFN